MKTKADEVLGVFDETLRTGTEKKRFLKQYTDSGNDLSPTIQTREHLEAGVYVIHSTMQGPVFSKHAYATDELLKFDNSEYNWLLEEVQKFQKLRDNFHKMGFTHKRGIGMRGIPGTGKSCLIKMMMEQIVGDGDVVFSVSSPYTLIEGLKAFREVEPERFAFVVLEDLDGMGGERQLLELFDGDCQVDGVLYIATTNYFERLSERLTRVGRFDKWQTIRYPNAEGRKAYLEHKLGIHESAEHIEKLVQETKGLGFNHLKELIIAVYCLENGLSETLHRLRDSANPAGRPLTEDSSLNESIKGVLALHKEYELLAKGMNEKAITLMLADAYLDDHHGRKGGEVSGNNNHRIMAEENPLSKADAILKEFAGAGEFGDFEIGQSIKDMFIKKLKSSGIEGVFVDEVTADLDGDIVVTFSDDEGNSMDILFGVDPDDGAFAMVLDDSEDEVTFVELDPAGAPITTNKLGQEMVDLEDLTWMNPTTLKTILQAGDIGDEINGKTAAPDEPQPVDKEPDQPEGGKAPEESFDEHGNKIVMLSNGDEYAVRKLTAKTYDGGVETIEELFRKVIRGGKVTKLPVIRQKRKRILTGKQRLSLAKASRKANSPGAKRKRAKSIKIRKRLSGQLKQSKLPKGFRAQGAARTK